MGIYKKLFLLLFFLVILPAVSHAQVTLININTAGTAELQTLNGIGPAYAQRIIDYRNTNGPFGKIEDIKKVSGIGDVTFSKIRDYITVGEVGLTTESSSNSTSTTTDQTTTTTTTTASSQGSSSSAHYSAIPISDLETELKFEVSAGRDRLGITGSPLEFKVETNIKHTRSNIFKWNFGDGTIGYGVTLSHAYEYPGEYAVVLNGSFPGGEAVARVNVKIIEPEIAVTIATPDRIELKNNSKYEASLFGRTLVSGGKVFIFPQDTIIKAGQSISFGARVTGFHPNSIQDVNILVIGESVMQPYLAINIEKQRLEKIVAIRDEIAVLQQQRLALLPRSVSSPEVVVTTENSSSTPQTALVLDSVSQVKSSRMNGWLETLKRFFFRTR